LDARIGVQELHQQHPRHLRIVRHQHFDLVGVHTFNSRLREPAQRFQQVALIEIAFHQVGVGADIDAPFAVLA
jgi:hypothetical protein